LTGVDKQKKFADNLRTLRKERGWSQQDLALKIHYSQQCISQWENMQIEPTLSSLWILSDVFEISVDELIGKVDF
jgi:transcriptional regulator with XRE-family HTH domain